MKKILFYAFIAPVLPLLISCSNEDEPKYDDEIRVIADLYVEPVDSKGNLVFDCFDPLNILFTGDIYINYHGEKSDVHRLDRDGYWEGPRKETAGRSIFYRWHGADLFITNHAVIDIGTFINILNDEVELVINDKSYLISYRIDGFRKKPDGSYTYDKIDYFVNGEPVELNKSLRIEVLYEE